jgi:CBS domain containing-hemolysin-like protein
MPGGVHPRLHYPWKHDILKASGVAPLTGCCLHRRPAQPSEMLELSIIVAIALVIDALISATEAALLAVPHSRVVAARAEGKKGAAVLEKLKVEIQRPLSALVILSNIVTIITAWVVGVVAVEKFGRGVAGALIVVFTVLVIIFAELVPKIIGVRTAETVALASARPLRVISSLLNPLIRFTYYIAGVVSPEKSSKVSEKEIEAMVMMGTSSGTIEPDEAAMIRQIFNLNDITTRDLMTPRGKVFFLEGEKTLSELKQEILGANHSRIPVVNGDSFDNIIGVVHQRDLLIALDTGRSNERVKTFAKKPLLVPEQLLADELLREFQKARTHLAVVIDEHGETSGVVTLEDCLEELVGEIIDEKDVVPELIKRVTKDEIISHGETRGRYVNSLFQTTLPETKTLMGFLQEQFHRIPEKGEVLVWENLEFRIEEASAGQIERLRIVRRTPVEKQRAPAGAATSQP